MQGPMNCSIRSGTLQDAQSISALVTRLAKEFIVKEFREEGRKHFLGELTPKKMRERLCGDYRFFLAERDTRLVGVAALRGISHLYYLFVVRACQRQGIAHQLWLTVEETCRNSGHRGVITVNSSTYAIPVYRRFGFVRKGASEEKHGVIHHPMEFSPPTG